MPRMLFVDTSAWYALADRSAREHAEVAAALAEARRRREVIVTSHDVIDETLTLTRAKLGHAAALRLGDLIWRKRGSELLEIDAPVREAAWAIFAKYADHSLSFTDCTSAALMRQRGIERVLTLDRDFVVLGFEVVPEAP